MPDDARIQRLSFSQILPLLQLAWDSTSLGELKTCARRYQYNILEGYVTRTENVHLRFGSEFHAALEYYDRLRARESRYEPDFYIRPPGASHEDALLGAVRFTLERTWDEKLGRPWTSDEPTKTRDTLIRSIIWYLDQFENDPCETIILNSGEPAVELSFRFEIGIQSKLTGEEFVVCGHLDRVARFQDRKWIMDRKTTKSTISEETFNNYTPDNQMTLYTFAGNIIMDEPIAGVILDVAQVVVTFSRFQRRALQRTPAQLEEWTRDLAHWLAVAESHVAQNYWPQNDKACHLFGGCPYRPVCSASPEIRPALLSALYTRRSWDPLVTREVSK